MVSRSSAGVYVGAPSRSRRPRREIQVDNAHACVSPRRPGPCRRPLPCIVAHNGNTRDRYCIVAGTTMKKGQNVDNRICFPEKKVAASGVGDGGYRP